MPFLEISDFCGTDERGRAKRRDACKLVTRAVAEILDVNPDIVTTYFSSFSDNAYGHAGEFAEDAAKRRIFIKVHALRRSATHRRKLAGALAESIATAYSVDPAWVAIYFFERSEDEVSHAGILACDAKT